MKMDSFDLVLSIIINSVLIWFIIWCLLNSLSLPTTVSATFVHHTFSTTQLPTVSYFVSSVYLRRRKTLLKLIHAALPRKGRQHVKIRLALLKVSLFIHLTTAEARRLCKDPLLFAYELTSRFSSHRAPSVPNLRRQLRCLSPQQIDFSVKTFFCAAKQSHFKLERFFPVVQFRQKT